MVFGLVFNFNNKKKVKMKHKRQENQKNDKSSLCYITVTEGGWNTYIYYLV